MGKQRTSRPQAFKATAAATSEMKAHVGKNNPASVDLQKAGPSESQFGAGELAQLVEHFTEAGAGVKCSQLIPISGYPSLKLSNNSKV